MSRHSSIRVGSSFFAVAAFLFSAGIARAEDLPRVTGAEVQPLLAQASRLNEALAFLGSGLLPEDVERIKKLRDAPMREEVAESLQKILDPYCLAMVRINPEARVSVLRGPARAVLMRGGWKSFLIKVHNEAGISPELGVESPNALPLLHRSTGAKRTGPENLISPGEVANRFLELALYGRAPLLRNLSGVKLEYAVLQVYSRDEGKREAKIGFHVGAGTQDVGFRNAVDILFDCQPSVKVVFRVKDHDGSPAMASFTITDGIERIVDDPVMNPFPPDYRLALALRQPWDMMQGPERARVPVAPMLGKRLIGVYPLPSRRVATDEYPDFFFHAQVYRSDGEHVYLPPGSYDVQFTRGPEYLSQTMRITIPSGVKSYEVPFTLKRWTNLAGLGWYSADHHVHAAGCSHYESPQEGVDPQHMWRQALGEDLNVACVLAWGPSWYHQKQFFEGKPNALSTRKNLMRYDVEVSGFPSSHAGHVVLLRLKEDDYPETTKVEEWPSWTLPVLQWARSQGGAVGYAHSGSGLAPLEPTDKLPNYVVPQMNGIGANEYIVTVAHGAVDFYSAGDTPPLFELNMWYHTLNAGFRTRLSGETDFPCIFDDRVGMGRSYAKLEGALDFDRYVQRIVEGRSYVSEGRSHIIDFTVNGLELGARQSQLDLDRPQSVKIKAKVAAYLPEEQDALGAAIAARPQNQPPFWDLERARIGKTRKVPVELVVNGEAVARTEVVAGGAWSDVEFEHRIDRSSWIALRILPSSHTNPVFALVGGKPIRASKASAEWCRKAVDRCWTMKEPRIRTEEKRHAEAAYNQARQIYDRIIQESEP
jgi:hypothetical protein